METKKLTPQQRLSDYEIFYKWLPQLPPVMSHLCWMIKNTRRGTSITDYPEIMAKRPNGSSLDAYWWQWGDKKIRLDILQQCINEVSQLIENGN